MTAVAVAASAAAAQSVRPDPVRTPGALNPDVTPATIHRTVCVAGWTATVRPPAAYTGQLKRQQLQLWGLPGLPADFEEDHRVPLSAGGAPFDVANLWPEPRTGPCGAHAKDRLEDAAHRSLCGGWLSLADDRALFLGDWVEGYRRLIGPIACPP